MIAGIHRSRRAREDEASSEKSHRFCLNLRPRAGLTNEYCVWTVVLSESTCKNTELAISAFSVSARKFADRSWKSMDLNHKVLSITSSSGDAYIRYILYFLAQAIDNDIHGKKFIGNEMFDQY